jgi:hypothetical protein
VRNKANWQRSFKFEVSSVRNKANFRTDSDGQGWARLLVASPGPVVQTNPICRRRAGKTIARAFGFDDATRHGGNCAKQSQLVQEFQESSFRFEAGEPSVESFESSDFKPHTSNFRRAIERRQYLLGEGSGAIVRNKANWQRSFKFEVSSVRNQANFRTDSDGQGPTRCQCRRRDQTC